MGTIRSTYFEDAGFFVVTDEWYNKIAPSDVKKSNLYKHIALIYYNIQKYM